MDVLTERSSRVVSVTKLHRAAVRRAENRFLAEGFNAVDAALTTGSAQQLLVRADDEERHAGLIERAGRSGIAVHRLTGRAAAKLSETTTAPGIFAVCELLTVGLGDALGDGPAQGFLVVAVEANDPGNAGTLIRCADAMGADAVILAGRSVDPHNGKCVRASAGSIFHLPVVRDPDVDAVLAALRERGIPMLATAADGELRLDAAGPQLSAPHAWLFGNEAHGLSDAVLAAADHRVSIPLRGRAESLNLAAASAICLYASAAALTG